MHVRRGVAITAGSLTAVAVVGGAVWAGLAPSSGRAATSTPINPPVVAAASTNHTTPPSSPVAVASMASSAAAVGICELPNLQVTNPWGFESGMGGSTVEVVFRNVGAQPCSLAGWPTVSTPGMHTKVQYQTTTGAGFMVPVSRIVLAPGESGDAALDLFGAPGNTYSQACFGAGSWAVTLPGSHQPTLVPWPKYQGACPGGTVEVSPFYIPDPESVTGFSSADPATISQL
jgi:hypothetical protein